MFIATKKRLGEMLIEAKLISHEQLQTALERQKETNERLGKVMVQLGFVSETDLIRVLENQLGIPSIRLSKLQLNPELGHLIPESVAHNFQVLPIKKSGDRLTLAMVDPLDVLAMDEVRMTTGCDIDPVIALDREMKTALAQTFGIKDSLEKLMDDISESDISTDEEIGLDQLRNLVEDAPIVKVVNSLLEQAVQERASDIHVEPQENKLRVRYRIDGVLREVTQFPKRMQSTIISRLKIMAELDISERRVPQDGRIQLTIAGKEIDLRVSSLPTIYGEKVVMRILDKTKGLYGIEELGLSPKNLKLLTNIIKKPNGIILATGPTGSGKTTTLYSFLKVLNSPQENIITLEDPVEYTLPGITQVQVNVKTGLTFASGLRSVLRQDPDIVMVGEIRDAETARIAIQSAMTGHLVLSTLHTNNASGTLIRLVDMGIEPFLVASTVEAVVAQRLVRALCPECKEAYEIPDSLRSQLFGPLNGISSNLLQEVLEDESIGSRRSPVFYKAKGCPFCRGTGYVGRIALHEVLEVNDEIRDLINRKVSSDQIERLVRQQGMLGLHQDGLLKALKGLTSMEEVMRTVYIESHGS